MSPRPFTPLSTEPLAGEWHPTLNELSPDEIALNSNRKVWWLGQDCQHVWDASPNARASGRQGCPFCAGKRVLAGFNDLATTHPDIAALWHPTLNGKLLPSQVSAGSKKEIAWLCQEGHIWTSTVLYHGRGYGCRACKSVAFLEPALATEWHPTLNGALSPVDVSAKSGTNVWWEGSCGHEWLSSPHSRTRGAGCHYCTGQAVLPGFNDLATTHPEVARNWHPTLNGSLTPQQISYGSRKQKVWWLNSCGHAVQQSANSRSRYNGCGVCHGNVILPGFNDLASTRPDLAVEWHPTKNGNVNPTEVLSSSLDVAWWMKPECGHEFPARIVGRANSTLAECYVCANKWVVPGINDLATTRPEVASEWHPTLNGEKTPQEVSFGSSYKAWWRCRKDPKHVWTINISDRSRGSGCPDCNAKNFRSKPEKALAALIESWLPDDEVYTNIRSVIKGELDIYIPSKKVAVEFNGIYHHTERGGKDATYHERKWQVCKDAGVQLIQVWEDEWRRNPEQVKRMLAHKLGVPYGGEPKVGARKTQAVKVTKAMAEEFLATHHVQGYANGAYYLALVPKTGDVENITAGDLLAVLVLKREAGTDGKTLNIIRYATSAIVPGGFTKLLTYAERTYRPEKFITFSDHCVSDGGLYANNGFVADKELPPDYMYVVRNERKHKFGYRLKRFRNDPNLKWVDGLSERELAELNGLHRIWDAGKTRWVKTVR